MVMDKIIIKGAKENNLKNIDFEITRDKLIVFKGVSGSGKSQLAFETIYAEGQRRYMESLSSYARQLLGQMEKSDVDNIEGRSFTGSMVGMFAQDIFTKSKWARFDWFEYVVIKQF